MSRSLRDAIQENRQRRKYRRVLARLRLRFFDYQDAGILAFAKYLHVVEKVTGRLYYLTKNVAPNNTRTRRPCSDPDWYGTEFFDHPYDEDGEPIHCFGPFVNARFTGEPVRHCQVPGCRAMSLDGDDDEDFEVEPPDMSTLPPEFPDPVM